MVLSLPRPILCFSRSIVACERRRIFSVTGSAENNVCEPKLETTSFPGSSLGWSRAYVYKSNPHRGWILDLILSTLSMEVKGAFLFIKQVMFQRSCATGVSGPFYLNFYKYEMLIEREVCLLSLLF